VLSRYSAGTEAGQIIAMNCPACKLENPPNTQWCDCGYNFLTGRVDAATKTAAVELAKSKVPVSAGYAFGLLAPLAPFIFILPLHKAHIADTSLLPFLIPGALGLVGMVCGAAAVAAGRRLNGLVQIAVGLICGFAGTAIGFTMGTGFDH
jgi:hypothetical protein